MTVETTHKVGCDYPQRLNEERLYRETYPEYCRRCLGEGLTHWTEPHGEPMSDLCNGYTEQGVCPRCRQPVDMVETGEGEYFRCGNCGANDFPHTPSHMTAPYVECICPLIDPEG